MAGRRKQSDSTVEESSTTPELNVVNEENPENNVAAPEPAVEDHLNYSGPTIMGQSVARIWVTATCAENRNWAVTEELPVGKEGKEFLSELMKNYHLEYGEPVDQVAVKMVYRAHDRGRTANNIFDMAEFSAMASSPGPFFQRLKSRLVSLI